MVGVTGGPSAPDTTIWPSKGGSHSSRDCDERPKLAKNSNVVNVATTNTRWHLKVHATDNAAEYTNLFVDVKRCFGCASSKFPRDSLGVGCADIWVRMLEQMLAVV